MKRQSFDLQCFPQQLMTIVSFYLYYHVRHNSTRLSSLYYPLCCILKVLNYTVPPTAKQYIFSYGTP